MSSIYYCINDENNNCPKKNHCVRYLEVDKSNYKATLYKVACVDSNGRALFINKEKIKGSDLNSKETN